MTALFGEYRNVSILSPSDNHFISFQGRSLVQSRSRSNIQAHIEDAQLMQDINGFIPASRSGVWYLA